MTIVDLGAQVTRAVNLMQLRRPEQAETLLREVLVADATHWGALHQLAWLRWQQEDYAEATALAERLLMLGPDRVHGHLMLARILHSEDRDAEAEPHARRALEIDPHLPQAYTVLAEILNGLDELGESWDLAEQALRLAPDYDEPYEVIIAVAGRTGGWDRAEAFALEALRQHPQLSLLHSWLGLIRSGQGRDDEARREFATALATNPEPPMLDCVAGLMELTGAAVAALADVYDRICQVRGLPNLTVPGSAGSDPALLARQAEIAERSYHASMLVNGTQEHLAAATELVDVVLAAEPGNQRARFVRAQIQRDAGDYPAALPIALALLDEGFDNEELHRVIVHCQDELGAYANTLASLDRAEERYPEAAWFPVFHAQLLFTQGNPAGAEPHARRAIELRPDITLSYGILAKSLAQQEKYEAAWHAAVDTLVHEPDEFDDFTAVAGFILEPLGPDAAIQLAQDAIQAHPELAALRVWLGALHLDVDEYPQARTQFETVLATNPAPAVRGLAIACLDMCEQPVELADLYQAFSAAG
jgi:tetratricopeptide (TPR) repeat protein